MVSRPALWLVLLAALSLSVSGAWAQTRSTSFDYTAYNAYWNGANWLSFGSGYGNVLGTDTTTGNFNFYTTGNAASAGLARTLVPVVAMSGSGAVSATSFVGYTGSFGNVNATGTVSTAALVVNGVAITGSAGSSDRIASSTTVTNTTQVTANSSGYISLTTGGTTTGYFNTAGGLVVPSVSTTGTISGTRGYFAESLGVGRAIQSWMPSNSIVAKGEVIADAGLAISAGTGLSWEDGHVSVASNDGTDVELRTDYVARLKIISNGYVGINTTDPQSTLDVHGTVSATSFVGYTGSFGNVNATGTVSTAALVVNGVTITGTGSSSGVPAGAVMYFAMSTPPSGWLEANGAPISRTTYATLFAAIGTTYGAGDDTTTFNLPDLRGEFIRGWDHSRGIDSGRSFGVSQTDAFKSHNHISGLPESTNIGNYYGHATMESTLTTIGKGSSSVATSNYTSDSGGSETRPHNIALLPCIKY